MANVNRVILIGNLTRDVELRHTQGGTAIAKFGMAINRKWSHDGETKESTCFVDLTAWGKAAETIQRYTKKGSPLFVEGRLEYSSWDGDDGKKRSKLEVVVEQFQLLRGSEPAESDAPAHGPEKKHRPRSATGGGADYGDDAIPF